MHKGWWIKQASVYFEEIFLVIVACISSSALTTFLAYYKWLERNSIHMQSHEQHFFHLKKLEKDGIIIVIYPILYKKNISENPHSL